MKMTRVLLSFALVAAIFLAGCGQGKPKRVPDVRGARLDLAEATLESHHLGYDVHGGGNLGVIEKDNWTVCSQTPSPGKEATTVDLVVARSCSEAGAIPDTVGLEARSALENVGVDVSVSTYDEYYGEGDDTSASIIVEANWDVCEQNNDGDGLSTELIVAHVCP